MILELRPKDDVYLRMREDDVRRSRFLQFLDQNRIAVEQTDPILDESLIRSLIFFTYCPDKPQKERWGFHARIEDQTPDGRIIIKQLSRPFVCDLRLWPRIHFHLLPGSHAFRQDQEIQVINVSGGGTHFVLSREDGGSCEVGSLVQIKFTFETGETTADGRMMRLWTDLEGMRHAEVQFFGHPEIQDFIYRKA